MPIILIVAFVFLVIFNLWLFHSVFHVFYFNLGFGLLREFIGAAFAAVAEIFLLYYLGMGLLAILGGIFSTIISVLVGALGIVGVIAAVIIVILLIKKIIQKIKNDKCDDVGQSTKVQDENLEGKDISEVSDTMFCTHCGKKISRTTKFCNYCGCEVTYKGKEQ